MGQRIHFIAIGGSAMHSLAIALAQHGHQISGSDDAIFDPSFSILEKRGLLPEKMGWFPEKITPELDAVILGMHAKLDNPELVRAQGLGLKIYSYPQYLYECNKEKTRIVIAGSHGKTTITAMILHVLNYHQIAIDYMIGAALEGYDNSVLLTQENDFVLLEGDEYPSSPIDPQSKFLWYQPQIAVVSGIARDHVNVFPTDESYIAQFESFINSIQPGGVVIYNSEDSVVSRLVLASENTIRKTAYQTMTHQIHQGATFLETNEGLIPLTVFGSHNMANLSAAQWVCQLVGVSEEEFVEAIPSFKGASKRLECLIKGKTSWLYKDFAHSPSKVTATAQAVKTQFGEKKLIACLELHTYSSLDAEFLPAFTNSLNAADQAFIFYDPVALKIKKRPLLEKETIEMAFKQPNVIVFENPTELHQSLLEYNYEDAVLLMMSSGNYGGLNWDNLISRVGSF